MTEKLDHSDLNNNSPKSWLDYTNLTPADVQKIIQGLSPEEKRILELTNVMNEKKPETK